MRLKFYFNSFILTLERPQKTCTRLAFIKGKQFSYFRNGKEYTEMYSRPYMWLAREKIENLSRKTWREETTW
jgi:hypothetical protein